MTDFSGKTALVTGGTRGIGRAVAELLFLSGCRVIYTGTRPQDSLKSSTTGKIYWQLDLNDPEGVDSFLKRMRKLESLDILVNNAGINIIEPIDRVEIENWDKIIRVNLTGAMLLIREAAGLMRKNKTRGRILNISSIFGIVSKSGRASYSASKAGLLGLTRAAALDLAKDGILVNALCPGFTLTDLTRSILSAKEIETLSREIPAGRFAKEEEIAQAAVFFCSEMNTYITGQAVVVDGGAAIR